MVNKEILVLWQKEFPVGAKILWRHYLTHDWLPGVVAGHNFWIPERGKLDAAIIFRLDSEPKKVKQADGHQIHYEYRAFIKLA